ncbi:MAG: hypothetical protein JSR82_10760 [Verrucomicrobia bacterium]|nr:hypothetical protein [Verrucomicrobiota bacterium]
MARPDPARSSAERVRAAEDNVATFPRWLLVGAGLAVLALTAWMLVARQGGRLPAEVRAASERVLREQSVRALLDRDVSTPVAVQGVGGFALLAPVRTTVRSRMPEFRWRPLPGATGYRVFVERPDGGPLESPVLGPNDVVWRAPELPVGVVLRWRLHALRETAVEAELPKSGPGVAFKILAPEDVAQLEEVEIQHPREPFLQGVARARLGLRSEARLAFEAAKGDPTRAALAAKLAAELE